MANQMAKQKTMKVLGSAMLLLGIAVGSVLLLRGCTPQEQGAMLEQSTPQSGISYDENATQGGWDTQDTGSIVDALNQKVEQGMINISMNTAPVFSDGASAGNLMIVNESINNYPQVLELTRNDTGELIYKSGAIAEGSKIEYAKLDVELDAGTYDCTALFYNVDPSTGAYLGCAGAIITITVLE